MKRVVCALAAAWCWACAAAVSLDDPPPPQPVRAPAEFEPTEALVLQWDYGEQNDVHRFLIRQTRLAGAEVHVLVDSEHEGRRIAWHLTANRIDAQGVHIRVLPTDNIWLRDYAPAAIYFGPDAAPGLVQWRYDAPEEPRNMGAAGLLAKALDMPRFRADRGRGRFMLDGGDYLTDGFGRFFTSWRARDNNGGDHRPDLLADALRALEDFAGITEVQFLGRSEPDMGLHLDMYIKLLDEETVLIAQCREDDANRAVIERDAAHFKTLPSCYGRPYRVLRVPMPGRTCRDDLRTYVNSVIVNNRVLVPVYGVPADETALQTYREALPGYHVEGFDCRRLIRSSGALHCITGHIHARRIVRVAHPRFAGPRPAGAVPFEAEVWTADPVAHVTLYTRRTGEDAFVPHTMLGAGGAWRVNLDIAKPGRVEYYIEAEAGGVRGCKPQNGGQGGYLTLDVVPVQPCGPP